MDMKHFRPKSMVQSQFKAVHAFEGHLMAYAKWAGGLSQTPARHTSMLQLTCWSEVSAKGSNHWFITGMYANGRLEDKEQNLLLKSEQCGGLNWQNFCNKEGQDTCWNEHMHRPLFWTHLVPHTAFHSSEFQGGLDTHKGVTSVTTEAETPHRRK